MAGREEFKEQYDPSPSQMHHQEYIKKLEAENAALKKQIGTDQSLFDYIKDSIHVRPKPGKVHYSKPKLQHADLIANLIITDQHAEEFVSSEEMEGLAHYDWEVFKSRMEKTAQKTLELTNIMRQASNIRELHIWSLGDWFLGQILPHEGSYAVTMPMPAALPEVGFAFGDMIVGLSAHFERIFVNGMCGNHGRDGKKRVFKMYADRNWDMSVYLIARRVAAACKNVHWIIPKSIMDIATIAGWNCLLTHSGEVNMNNRVPYYPIETTFDMEHKTRSGTDKDFSFAFTGHWHHFAVLDRTNILCPCMVGPNQFSRFKLHRRSKAEQLLCFWTEKHGLVNYWPIIF